MFAVVLVGEVLDTAIEGNPFGWLPERAKVIGREACCWQLTERTRHAILSVNDASRQFRAPFGLWVRLMDAQSESRLHRIDARQRFFLGPRKNSTRGVRIMNELSDGRVVEILAPFIASVIATFDEADGPSRCEPVVDVLLRITLEA